ncbi:MAG TPA: hypothetical protein VFX98_05835 [Longimicrobiaceae bacterium]|nr:hypothetical protein [Longimicrobiaceae bacterium]
MSAADPSQVDLPPDPVVEAYKAHVDRTLIRENLRLTPEQRIRQLQQLVRFAEELKQAGARLTDSSHYIQLPSSSLNARSEAPCDTRGNMPSLC